jgi:outer membrane protein
MEGWFYGGIRRKTLGFDLPCDGVRGASWQSPKQIPETNSKEFKVTHMKSKFTRFLLAMLFILPVAALAQAGSTDPLPAAPSSAGAATPDANAPTGNGKVGTINIEQAIFASNEGQRDFQALEKKLEPKQTELKNLNDEVESLKKQLSGSGDKLNEDSRATLVKQIEQKQKSLERSVQDARDDAQAQQNEIAQKILQKMAPIIVKYAGDKNYGMIIDTSNPWPQGPVLWAGPSVDITKTIVDAYNVQSGVPAPARTTTKPATGTGTGAKPAAPGTATKPAGTGTPAPK